MSSKEASRSLTRTDGIDMAGDTASARSEYDTFCLSFEKRCSKLPWGMDTREISKRKLGMSRFMISQHQNRTLTKCSHILAKAQAAWDACPDYFRFDRQAPEVREQPFRDLDVYMQYLLYMDYLHSTFLLHRAVVKNVNVGHQALFDTARRLLSSVLATISNRDGPHGLNTAHGRHFSWLVCIV